MGKYFWVYYGLNPINYISDFFGLSYLLHNNLDYTMNATWWYMSVCIVYYIVFPFLYRIMERFAEALVLFSFILIIIPFDYSQLLTWLFPFVLVIYCAKDNIFERVSCLLSNSFNRFIVSFLLVMIFAYFRHFIINHSVLLDGFFGLSIIMFAYLIISNIPILNHILEELGKYSGMIFMFHTFIYSYYFKEFIYGFKYSLLICFVFVIICYLIARLIKYIQHLINYDKLIEKLITVKDEKVSNNRCK